VPKGPAGPEVERQEPEVTRLCVSAFLFFFCPAFRCLVKCFNYNKISQSNLLFQGCGRGRKKTANINAKQKTFCLLVGKLPSNERVPLYIVI